MMSYTFGLSRSILKVNCSNSVFLRSESPFLVICRGRYKLTGVKGEVVGKRMLRFEGWNANWRPMAGFDSLI